MGVARFSDGRVVDYDQTTGQFLVNGQAIEMSALVDAENGGTLQWQDDATRTWAYQNFASAAAAPAAQPEPEPAVQPTTPMPQQMPPQAAPAAAQPGPVEQPKKKGMPVWAIILLIILALFLLCGCIGLFAFGSAINTLQNEIITAPTEPSVPSPDDPFEDPTEPSPDPGTGEAPAGGAPTLDQYNQIENGMSYDEVVSIMGSAGEELSSADIGGQTVAIYQWASEDGMESVTVTIQNDEVFAKAQFGLE